MFFIDWSLICNTLIFKVNENRGTSMAKMGVFIGTAGQTSMQIADAISNEFAIEAKDIINMETDFGRINDMLEYDVLFLGSSTWGQGDPHFAWADVLLDMKHGNFDFSGKLVAFFGAGDCQKHSENFCSALGKLHSAFTALGAKAVGFIPKDLYTYEFSLAEVDGQFCGCAIDHFNEASKTPERIETWINTLKEHLS